MKARGPTSVRKRSACCPPRPSCRGWPTPRGASISAPGTGSTVAVAILGGRRCADRHEMSRTPPSAGELVDILRSRHAVVMAGRPDERRGQFTELANHCRSDPYAIRPVGDQTRRRSDPYDPKPGNVVVVAVLGCHRQVVGDRRRRDPRVVDRHFLASVSKGKAQSCPGMSYCFVDR